MRCLGRSDECNGLELAMTHSIPFPAPKRVSRSIPVALDAIAVLDAAVEARLAAIGDTLRCRTIGRDHFHAQRRDAHRSASNGSRSAAATAFSVFVSCATLTISLWVLLDGVFWGALVVIALSAIALASAVIGGLMLHRRRLERRQEALFGFLHEVGTRGALGDEAWCKTVWNGSGYDLQMLDLSTVRAVYAIEIGGRCNLSCDTDRVVPWIEGMEMADLPACEKVLSEAGIRMMKSFGEDGAIAMPSGQPVPSQRPTVH